MHPPAAMQATSAATAAGTLSRVFPSIRERIYRHPQKTGPEKTPASARRPLAPALRTAPAAAPAAPDRHQPDDRERNTAMGLLDQLGGMLGGNQPGATPGGAGDVQQL